MNTTKEAWAQIAAAAAAEAQSLERALMSGARQQPDLLASILRANAGTEFGVEHGFADIEDPDDFRRRVPIRRDDEYQPWLERVAGGSKRVLTSAPVVAFESTAAPRVPS